MKLFLEFDVCCVRVNLKSAHLMGSLDVAVLLVYEYPIPIVVVSQSNIRVVNF